MSPREECDTIIDPMSWSVYLSLFPWISLRVSVLTSEKKVIKEQGD